jgi:hypothetical protein
MASGAAGVSELNILKNCVVIFWMSVKVLSSNKNLRPLMNWLIKMVPDIQK